MMDRARTQEVVIRMAMDGIRPAIIAERIDRKPATVYHYINRARRAGIDIPKFDTGPVAPRINTLAAICPDDTSKLRIAAHRRGLTVKELAQQLLHVIAREGLTSAILDDGLQS